MYPTNLKKKSVSCYFISMETHYSLFSLYYLLELQTHVYYTSTDENSLQLVHYFRQFVECYLQNYRELLS